VFINKIEPKVKIGKTTYEEDKGSKVIIKLNNSTWVNHLKKGLGSWTTLNPR
jgi:hypothetical protein